MNHVYTPGAQKLTEVISGLFEYRTESGANGPGRRITPIQDHEPARRQALFSLLSPSDSRRPAQPCEPQNLAPIYAIHYRNLYFGRGGQAILTVITWKVFGGYAATSTATQPLTFATYRTLFADSGPSVTSTANLLHDFIKFRCLASKWASICLIYSLLLILAFPTLVSSSTGYTTLSEAFISIDDNTLVPISDLTVNYAYTTWNYSNRTHTFEEIEQQGTCLPSKDRYLWGVSFLQVFSLFISLAFWAITCLALALSSYAHQNVIDAKNPQGYQAMGILVRRIDEQLTESGIKTSTTSDQELRSVIKAELGGGSIKFDASGQARTFRQWLAAERQWFIGLCVSTAGALTFFITGIMWTNGSTAPWCWLFFPLFYLSLGTFYAIVAGHSLGSRLFLIILWTASGVGITLLDIFLPFPYFIFKA
ncbi:hypothetical protein NPX13_g2984 [Xylaria arbuscula]|uniref:Uncharacterized protein n=1 Tax=Xylaria arbuscula TaxID=114810 RepID=A0A9W8TPT5_9PEZI|nr:hypothetical protein NPX13_g2984 [Xylaria arbuscula]